MKNPKVQTILDYYTNRNVDEVLQFQKVYNNIITNHPDTKISQIINPDSSNLASLFNIHTHDTNHEVFQLSYAELHDTMQIMTNVVTGASHLNHPYLVSYLQQLSYQDTTVTLWIKDLPDYEQVSIKQLSHTCHLLDMFNTVPINYVIETTFANSLNQNELQIDQSYQINTNNQKTPKNIEDILLYDSHLSNNLYDVLALKPSKNVKKHITI